MKKANLYILSNDDLNDICGGEAAGGDPGCFGRDRSAYILANGSIGEIISGRASTNAQINIDYMNNTCGMSVPADPKSS